MIDKPEYVNWANVWWILGAEHLTFEEVMGDFRKKDPADWFRGEKVCKDITGKNNTLYWKKNAHGAHCYVSGKIFLTPEIWEKKFLPKQNHPYPPPPQKSHGQPHRRWGKRRTWQSAWLVLNQPRQRGFWRNLRNVLYTLWSSKVRFWKGIFVL